MPRHPVLRIWLKLPAITRLGLKLPLIKTTTQWKTIVANLGMILEKLIKLVLVKLDEMLARNSYKTSR